MPEGLFILAAGVLLAGTLGAAVVADTLRLPALVLFLGIGMIAGSDGAGLIQFDDAGVARQIGTLALSLILFEGGLGASFADLRPVLRPAVGLAVVGTIVTALMTGLAAAALLGIRPLEGLLLGGILASTDGAAVFSMLRGSKLSRRLVHTLEGEAGLNDPVAVLLVVGFISWIQQPDYGLGGMLTLFIGQLTIGAVAGILVGKGAAEAMRRISLPNPGLYPVATVAAAAIAYGTADSLNGSGFLAVYLAGLTLISARPPAQMTIMIFHQGAAWLAQVALFLTLGLLVFPSQLSSVWIPGTLLAIFIVCIARPVAVLASTALDRFTPAETMLLSWAGLRGGVPVVLATYPVSAGIPGSGTFLNVVFFVVALSTLVQGMTMEPMARKLGLLEGEEAPAAAPPPAPVAAPAPVPVPAPLPVPAPVPVEHAPWTPADGDPAHPVLLRGARVVEHLRLRADAAGALVALADGRVAITGATLAIGPADALRNYATQRVARAPDAAERAWWHELAAALQARRRQT
jgi:cell volume regulation protein A